MFIRLVEIYPCLELIQTAIKKSPRDLWPSNDFKNNIVVKMELWDLKTRTWGKKKQISMIAVTVFIADYFFLAAILKICILAN